MKEKEECERKRKKTAMIWIEYSHIKFAFLPNVGSRSAFPNHINYVNKNNFLGLTIVILTVFLH